MQSSSFEKALEVELENFYNIDKYPSEYAAFNVLGMEIQIMDEKLSEILKVLPDKKRNIILLSYFMDMSDLEIRKLMNLVRSTIYRHKTSILKEIKKIVQGGSRI
jgi:DNA-directed RNA polymerase specialized sigma subunit